MKNKYPLCGYFTGSLYAIVITLCGVFTYSHANAQAPVAKIGASDSVGCSPLCISFSDASTNSPTSWLWTFAGGTPSSSTARNPGGVCYDTAGSFSIKLVVTNSSGKDSVTLINFATVTASPPLPSLSQSGDTLFCSYDSSYTLYQWYDTTTLIQGGTKPYFVITQTGDYNLVVGNKSGCAVAVGIVGIYASVPVAAFSVANQAICANSCISFINQSQNGTTYRWIFAGATTPTSTAANPSNICYNAPGTYDVTLVVTGNGGRDSIMLSNYINVGANPVVNATETSSQICEGQTDTLAVSGTLTYLWSPVINLTTITGPVTVASPVTSTTYTVVGTNAYGCTSAGTITVMVNAVPVATISNDTTICAGEPIQLFAGGGTDYSWSPDSSLTDAFISDPTAFPVATTTYTVTMSNNGCGTATATATITLVSPTPVPVLTLNHDTLFSSTDPSYTSYHWYLDNNVIAGAADTFLVASIRGNYAMLVANAAGCVMESGVVNVPCGNIIINAEVSNLTCVSCNDGSISNMSIYGGMAPYTYLWQPSGSTDSYITHLSAGVYTVHVTDSLYCTVSDSFNVACCLNAGCSSFFYIYPDTLLLHHYYIVSQATGVAPISYLWSWGDNTYDTTAFPTHTYSSPGFYPVCLKITDAVSCTDSTCHTFDMLRTTSGGTPITMTVINPNAVGTHEVDGQRAWSVYPNPAQDILSVYIADARNINNNRVAIMNLLGGTCYQVTVNRQKTAIDIADLPSGIYFVQLKSTSGSEVKKFIKE